MRNPKQFIWAIFFAFIAIATLSASWPTGANYLIICHSDLVDEMQPLADWKTQKGYVTRITTFADIGASDSIAVRNYIVNAYNTWTPRPEYILIAGTPGTSGTPNTYQLRMMLCGRTSYGNCFSDWRYGEMTGDIYHDIHIGRLPITTETNASVMVAKIMAYEKNPAAGDWLSKGTFCIRYDGDSSDSMYTANTDTAQAGATANGYTTLQRLTNTGGASTTLITNAINEGRGFISYRGQEQQHGGIPLMLTLPASQMAL